MSSCHVKVRAVRGKAVFLNRKTVIVVAALVGAIALGWFVWPAANPPCEFVSRSISPDGRFEIVLCRLPSTGVAMPGQGDDVSGIARLYNRRVGLVLAGARAELLSGYPGARWYEDSVDLIGIAHWDLPPAPSVKKNSLLSTA